MAGRKRPVAVLVLGIALTFLWSQAGETQDAGLSEGQPCVCDYQSSLVCGDAGACSRRTADGVSWGLQPLPPQCEPRAGDDIPPTIVSATPDFAYNPSFGVKIDVEFSEAIDLSTVTLKSVRLFEEDGGIVHDLAFYESSSSPPPWWVTGPTRVSFFFSAPRFPHRYRFVIFGGKGGVADCSGNTLAANFERPLSIGDLSDGSSDLPPLLAEGERCSCARGLRCIGMCYYSRMVDGPSSVSADIGVYGISCDAPYSDRTPLRIVSSAPSGDRVPLPPGLSAGLVVSVQLSRHPFVPLMRNGGFFRVYDDDGGRPVVPRDTPSYNPASHTLSYTIASPRPNQKYRAVLNLLATDCAGNRLDKDGRNEWVFKTAPR